MSNLISNIAVTRTGGTWEIQGQRIPFLATEDVRTRSYCLGPYYLLKAQRRSNNHNISQEHSDYEHGSMSPILLNIPVSCALQINEY